MRASATERPVGLRAAEPTGAPAWFDNLWVACGLLLILSIFVRLIDIGQLARFDELYTLLAARGWLADGVPRIADGVYDRVELYTVFVAWCLKLFGDNLVVARLPSVLFGSLLVVAVFLWTNAVAGRAAAWISGLLVALASMSVEMSQYARFYVLHALTFWLGAIGFYALATGQVVGIGRQIALAIGTALSLLCALYLQILSLIGLAGLGLWLAVAILLPALARRPAKQFWGVLAASVLVAALVAAAVLGSGVAEPLVRQYLITPLTVIQHKGEIWFYDLHLVERYPTLWPIVPLLALMAVVARPQPSLFGLVVFGAIFTLLSFAGTKSLRYLFFGLPFLYVVWAIALVRLWQVVGTTVGAALDGVVAHSASRLRPWLRWTLIIGGLGFLLLANGSIARTLLRPLGIHLEKGFSAGWPSAVPELEPWVRSADVVLTSYELHMLYYFGRADIVISKERLAEFADTEFARDPRTGLPVVSTPESVALVLACYPTGVIVTDTIKGWRAPTAIDDQTADVIARGTTPIDLPKRLNLEAFRWDTATTADPSACSAIPGYR